MQQRVDRWLRRLVINLLVAGPSFLILRLLLIPVVVAVATWAEARDFGLLRLVDLPALLATIIAILLLDYTMYGWHWLNHRVPLLWRFHHVHHTNLDLDVSTAFRFHFGEMLLSVALARSKSSSWARARWPLSFTRSSSRLRMSFTTVTSDCRER